MRFKDVCVVVTNRNGIVTAGNNTIIFWRYDEGVIQFLSQHPLKGLQSSLTSLSDGVAVSYQKGVVSNEKVVLDIWLFDSKAPSHSFALDNCDDGLAYVTELPQPLSRKLLVACTYYKTLFDASGQPIPEHQSSHFVLIDALNGETEVMSYSAGRRQQIPVSPNSDICLTTKDNRGKDTSVIFTLGYIKTYHDEVQAQLSKIPDLRDSQKIIMGYLGVEPATRFPKTVTTGLVVTNYFFRTKPTPSSTAASSSSDIKKDKKSGPE